MVITHSEIVELHLFGAYKKADLLNDFLRDSVVEVPIRSSMENPMTTPDLDQEKTSQEDELRILRQVSFASGLFQGDITVHTLLESLAEGVVIIDNSGTILLVNTRAEQIFGYAMQEFIGKPHSMLIPERFRKVHEEHQAQFFAQPRISLMGQRLELAGLRRDGSEFPAAISLSFIETINGVLALSLVSDLTLRKQYESSLRESEKLFRIQVECVKDYAILMLDAQGNVFNWNAGAERLKGYREEEIIGKHFSCFYPEEERDAGRLEGQLNIAAIEGRVEDEGWRIRKDGSRFWAEVILTALYDENVNLRGFSIVTHDITERKKAEDSLRFSEARFRALFRDNPVMIVTLDAEWTLLSVNPSCAIQLGYTIDELEGKSVLKLFHEDDRPAVVDQLRMCMHNPNQVYRWQFRKVSKDGVLLWVEEIAQAVHDLNGVLNILVVCQDITERKRAEEALKTSEEKLRYASTAADIGIWHWDLVNNELTWSERCNEFFGFPPGYPITYEAFLQSLHEEDRQRINEAVQKAQQEKTEYSVEMRVVQPDGRVRWIMSRGRVFYDDQGKPIRMHGIVMDITERKRAEEEIERLNASLAARAADLEDANRELEAFNYTVAHDLCNPLNVISSYCQVFMELCGDKLDENCMRYIQETYDGTLRMNRLIEALLNFSRLAHTEVKRDWVDLSSMARKIAEELKLAGPERRVIFRISDGIGAYGDANLLQVVLTNLLGNAWKYTRMREEAIIEFGVTEIKGKPAYFVRDNGDGFNKEEVHKIFAPFQRLSGAKESKGFGIGLATVERIIRRHGGRVSAEGEPGKGATFYFTLSADELKSGL